MRSSVESGSSFPITVGWVIAHLKVSPVAYSISERLAVGGTVSDEPPIRVISVISVYGIGFLIDLGAQEEAGEGARLHTHAPTHPRTHAPALTRALAWAMAIRLCTYIRMRVWI